MVSTGFVGLRVPREDIMLRTKVFASAPETKYIPTRKMATTDVMPDSGSSARVAKNAEFKALHQYFTKRSHNPLKKKQSIVALCGKLIRVLYTLGTKRIPYQPSDVLGPVRQAQLQMAA